MTDDLGEAFTAERIERSPGQEARAAIENAIARMIRAEHGKAGFEMRPLGSGYSREWEFPKEELALPLAVVFRDVATGIVRKLALEARGAGLGWNDVGAMLGFKDAQNEELSPAERAYEYMGPVDRAAQWRNQDYVHWRCRACEGYVRDSGPWADHPTDREEGHKDGCQRHADDIAEWRARVGLEDEED